MYVIELSDEDFVSIEPGIGGGMYRSPTPLPIPLVRDRIISQEESWTAKARMFEYAHGESSNEQAHCRVVLVCRKDPDKVP